jgi:hypothetical protein
MNAKCAEHDLSVFIHKTITVFQYFILTKKHTIKQSYWTAMKTELELNTENI